MLSLNYVNNLFLPPGSKSTKEIALMDLYRDSLRTSPQTVEVHNLYVQMEDPESKAKISISQSFGPRVGGKITVFLSIQAFLLVNKMLVDFSDDDIWKSFDILRALKNRAFESTITDKVRAGFR